MPMNWNPPKKRPNRPDPEDRAADQRSSPAGAATRSGASADGRCATSRQRSRRKAEPPGRGSRAVGGIGPAAASVGVIGRRPSTRPAGRPSTERPVAAGQLQEEVFERPVHLDPLAELGQGPAGQHPAVVDDPDRVGQLLGDREQVGRHQHGHPRPGLRDEQVLDDPGAPRVEADQRLVDDQDLGVVDQGRRRRRPAASSPASSSRRARRRSRPSRRSRSARRSAARRPRRSRPYISTTNRRNSRPVSFS